MNRHLKACLLCFFFALCAAAVLISARTQDERARASGPHDLYVAVNDQLAAFRSDDFRSAYRQASSGVQQKFSLSQFEAMIRESYGALASAERIEFGTVRMDGASAALDVFFFAEDGAMRTFLYSLRAEDGRWKIAGVEEMRSPPRGQRGAWLSV